MLGAHWDEMVTVLTSCVDQVAADSDDKTSPAQVIVTGICILQLES